MSGHRYTSDVIVPCRLCGKRYNWKGISSHERACERQRAELAFDEQMALQAVANHPNIVPMAPLQDEDEDEDGDGDGDEDEDEDEVGDGEGEVGEVGEVGEEEEENEPMDHGASFAICP